MEATLLRDLQWTPLEGPGIYGWIQWVGQTSAKLLAKDWPWKVDPAGSAAKLDDKAVCRLPCAVFQ